MRDVSQVEQESPSQHDSMRDVSKVEQESPSQHDNTANKLLR